MKPNSQIVLFSIIIILGTLPGGFAQPINTWTTHTSFNVVNDLTFTNENALWGATEGGVFVFEDGQFSRFFTTLEGLSQLDASVITHNRANDNIIMGYQNGVIDILDPEDNTITTLDDIKRADQFNPRSISDIDFTADSMLVATDFGIVVYDLNTLLVTTTFTKLGEFDRGIPVSDIIIRNDTIFAATQQGIATGNLNVDLLLQENWENLDSDNGLPQGQVNSIALQGNRIFASVSDIGNFIYDGISFRQTDLFGDVPVTQFKRNQDSGTIFGFMRSRVFSLSENGSRLSFPISPGRPGRSIAITGTGSNERIFIGTTAEGFLEIRQGEISQNKPDGPSINFVDGLTFRNGTLFAGTSRTFVFGSPLNSFKTYNIFDGESWRTFNRFNSELIQQRNYINGFRTAATDTFLYVSSWGHGILQQNLETDELRIFDNSNSAITGIPNNPDFIVSPGLEIDSNNGIWVTSFLSNPPLFHLPPGETEWIPVPKAVAVSNTDQYFNMLVDQNDQKWIALTTNQLEGTGLLVFDEGDINDPTDNRSIKLNREFNNGNLPDLKINAFVEDREGEIWIGTDRGVARFLFPDLILEPGAVQERRAQWLINADTTAESQFLLRDVDATALAVNGANQKWIGTRNDGLWLVNQTGSRILNHLTEENSPLLNDNITSLAMDNETATLFIGTEAGLTSFVDVPTEPVSELSSLFIFPNPFSYDKNSGQINIENLSDATTVNIITVDGVMVNQFDARGGRATWDGRNFDGQKLATGVYLIVAIDVDTQDKAVGKVLIVR